MLRKCHFAFVCAFFALSLCFAYGEQMRISGEDNKESIQIFTPGQKITIQQAIHMVLENNLTLKSVRYDVIMTDSDYERFQKKYSPVLNLEGGYLNQKLPESGMTIFTGDQQYQFDSLASISKLFQTGTMVSAGVKEVFFDANDPAIPSFKQSEPGYHTPVLFVSLQQELLKNAFGRNDRLRKEILKDEASMRRALTINMLSGLVVEALTDYWNVTVQKSSIENAKRELDSTRQVRDIIARNVRYGLHDAYDLNQYNALVAGAETKLARSDQRYRDAVRKLFRTLNVSPDTRVEGVTELTDSLPVLDSAAAVATAFTKRVDYTNAILALENSKKEMSLQRNAMLPSLTLGMDFNAAGQDKKFSGAFADSAAARYPAWQVRARLSYPLDDRELKTNLRNAEMKHRQAEISVEKLKKEVRDDVVGALDQVQVAHGTLLKSRTTRKEFELYYTGLLERFRQGKVGSVTVRLALEALTRARQNELETLVGYNVSLLRFDLAKNEIFERYQVDVEKYLKGIKE